MSKILSGFILVLLLSGCQSWRELNAQYDREYLLPVGARLELLIPIAFPKDHARVFLQQPLRGENTGVIGFSNGYRFSGSGVNEYQPYCELEVNLVSDGGFELMPGEFEIYKVEQNIFPWNFVGLPVRLAANDDSGSVSQLTYATDFWLRSSANPEVRKMSCRHVQEQEPTRFVSLAEMQQAIAGVFRIVQ